MDNIFKFYHQVPTPNAGLEKDVKSLFYDFFLNADMANKGRKSVFEVLNETKTRLDVLDNRWQDEVKRIAIRGKKSKGMFVSSITDKIRLYKFFEKKFNFVYTQNFKPVTYTNDKFREAMYMEISMLIAKYEFVYEYEVMAAAMHLLFKYFNIIRPAAVGYEWTFNPYDVNKMVTDIKENESSLLSNYYNYMVQNVDRKEPKEVHYKKQKPKSASDLFIGFSGETRADFVRYCARTWDVTAMTVSRWIKKFEITDEMILVNTDNEEMLMKDVEKQQKKLAEEQQKMEEEQQKLEEKQKKKLAEQQQKLEEAQKKLEEYRMLKTIKNS